MSSDVPAPLRPCARCVRDGVHGCEHLARMREKCALKDLSDQDLIEYALNRMWALERDNEAKRAGNRASRTYKSRNVVVRNALAGRCGAPKPDSPLRCMRAEGHEGDHKW